MGELGYVAGKHKWKRNHRYSLERSQQRRRQQRTSRVYIKQWRGGENMGLEPLGHCVQLKKSLQNQLRMVKRRAPANLRPLTLTDCLRSFPSRQSRVPPVAFQKWSNVLQYAWPFLKSTCPQFEFNAPLGACIYKYLSCGTWSIIEKSGGGKYSFVRSKGKSDGYSWTLLPCRRCSFKRSDNTGLLRHIRLHYAV